MHLPRNHSNSRHLATLALILALGGVSGCEVQSFIDPSELAPGQNYRQQPLTKQILNNLDTGVEEPNDEFVNAVDPEPRDLLVDASDYVIGKNDLISVSVMDLVNVGVETVKQMRVSESGNISLPLIGQLQAEGLTEAKLEQSIVDAYRKAALIQNAQVSVTVAEARARTFSILGPVAAQNQYAIIQSDFRLLDALVLAHDVVPSGIEYLYVIRQELPSAATTNGAATTKPATAPADDLAPRTQAKGFYRPQFAMADVAPATTNEAQPAANEPGTIIIEGKEVPLMPTNPPAEKPAMQEPARPDNNKAEPKVEPGMEPKAELAPEKPFEFKKPAEATVSRTIRVPLIALKNGELKYNIVVRPRDMIIVPQPITGEYYMGGHVARVGVYSLTGRKITLKQAVVSAGMLDGIAIPQRTEIIRRIGTEKEVFARVDLAKVFAGDQPDIFLKPNDVIQVGTNFFAPLIAAVRGGFRFTYGFGFLYDRNFAPTQRFR